MSRIFLSLAGVSTLLLVGAFVLGSLIHVGDPTAPTAAEMAARRWHMLTALAAIILATLVHSIVFTYFMGTGRWLEETSRAYGLGDEYHARNQRLKYRTLPGIIGCFVIFLATACFGAALDSGAWQVMTGTSIELGKTFHFVLAGASLLLNSGVFFGEYQSIWNNGAVVNEVLEEVRRIRLAKGLPVG